MSNITERFGCGLSENGVEKYVCHGLFVNKCAVACQALQRRFSLLGESHVPERGDTPGKGCRRPACEVIYPHRTLCGPTRRNRKVNMSVNTARKDQQVGSIKLLLSRRYLPYLD